MRKRNILILVTSIALTGGVYACGDDDGDIVQAPEDDDNTGDDDDDNTGDDDDDDDNTGDDDDDNADGGVVGGDVLITGGANYLLSSIIINPDGSRTTYIQTIDAFDEGPFDNANALEFAGGVNILHKGSEFFVGLTEEPVWVRYSVNEDGEVTETGRVNFTNNGVSRISYGNALVDENTAVSVFGSLLKAVVWNPTTMEITGEIELDHLARDGLGLENWTTVAHDGLVYIPGRWWETATPTYAVLPLVSLTILDPANLEVVGVAEDDRCASGGKPVLGEDGYLYVMGDGRNHTSQLVAQFLGEEPVDGCLLRIQPGETEFDPDFYANIPELTGGLQPITELASPGPGETFGVAKMYDPSLLGEDFEFEVTDPFAYWEEPAHRMFKIELSDAPSATPVEGASPSAVGFNDVSLEGKLYTGEISVEDNTSEVFEINLDEDTYTRQFTMEGLLNLIVKLR